jgi:hypothetical protein
VYHLTVAIGRFFEMLLTDIVKSAAGLVLAGFLVIAGAIGGAWVTRRICRRICK